MTHPLVWGSIIGYNPQEGFSIKWQQDRRDSRIYFFVNPALFWRPRGAVLLNMANPVQKPSPKPLLFWQFFPEISTNIHCTGHSPKAGFAFWRKLEPKTKTWSRPQNCFRILAKLGAKNKNPVTAPKLIPHFGKTWSQKTKNLVTTPKLISDFGETWSQKQNPSHS